MKIRCYTLFNCERTNVNVRREPQGLTEEEIERWNFQRKQQANHETLLQIIGIRASPENVTTPFLVKSKWSSDFGTKYSGKRSMPVWIFDFTVDKHEVYRVGSDPLGALLQDCNGVPMITELEECKNIDTMLMTDSISKNIHFEIVDETQEL